MTRIRSKLTYANVVASIALFGVLAGGGAWAHGKIGSKQLKKNAVATKHIKKKAVKAPKIANGAVTQAKLAPNAKVHWAVVGAQGSFLRGTSVVDADRLATGSYSVVFKGASSNDCGGIVTVGRTTNSAAFAYLVLESVDSPEWRVEVRDPSGNPVDRPYQIQVTC